LTQLELEDQEARLAGSMVPGEQKRLAFARVLHSARDLLLDEPVSGVGTQTRDLLKLLVRKLVDQGRSLLVVEHDIDFVLETCDEIMLLKEGRIACHGVPDETVRNAEFREFYSSLKVEESASA
jgi:ABC-type branched-subunit amino acid transport system ATPase component